MGAREQRARARNRTRGALRKARAVQAPGRRGHQAGQPGMRRTADSGATSSGISGAAGVGQGQRRTAVLSFEHRSYPLATKPPPGDRAFDAPVDSRCERGSGSWPEHRAVHRPQAVPQLIERVLVAPIERRGARGRDTGPRSSAGTRASDGRATRSRRRARAARSSQRPTGSPPAPPLMRSPRYGDAWQPPHPDAAIPTATAATTTRRAPRALARCVDRLAPARTVRPDGGPY